MEKKEAEIRSVKSLKDAIFKINSMFRTFFIESTGMDVLEGCEDLEEATEAYKEFLIAVEEQKKKVLDFSVPDIK